MYIPQNKDMKHIFDNRENPLYPVKFQGFFNLNPEV
jgi:hypothetical protein